MSEFGYNYTQMGTIIPGGSSIINNNKFASDLHKT